METQSNARAAMAAMHEPLPKRMGRPPIPNPDNRQEVWTGIRMSKELLRLLDTKRGATPRSTFIRNLIEQAVSCVKSGAE